LTLTQIRQTRWTILKTSISFSFIRTAFYRIDLILSIIIDRSVCCKKKRDQAGCGAYIFFLSIIQSYKIMSYHLKYKTIFFGNLSIFNYVLFFSLSNKISVQNQSLSHSWTSLYKLVGQIKFPLELKTFASRVESLK